MVIITTTSYKFNNYLSLAVNIEFTTIPHSLTSLKLPIINILFFYMLTSIFAPNKISQSSTLAYNVLVIVARFLDSDMNILIFVIGLSIGVFVDVVANFNDGPNISLKIGLHLREE